LITSLHYDIYNNVDDSCADWTENSYDKE
jgi:hypothetical protein